VHEVANFSLVPADDDLTTEPADENEAAEPKPDDFWSLAPREPIRAPARSGRTRTLLILGGVAALAFALGLVMPTPESIELSGCDDDGDGSDANVPAMEVPVGWSVTPVVVRNPDAIPQNELIPLVQDLMNAAASATANSDIPPSPQLAVCDPARHPGLLSANNALTQQDLDMLSAALC
jgi:hypothetical protein